MSCINQTCHCHMLRRMMNDALAARDQLAASERQAREAVLRVGKDPKWAALYTWCDENKDEIVKGLSDKTGEQAVLLERAMHMLLYVDAHMASERMPLAEEIAKAISHPWPPYPDAKDEDDESDGGNEATP